MNSFKKKYVTTTSWKTFSYALEVDLSKYFAINTLETKHFKDGLDYKNSWI